MSNYPRDRTALRTCIIAFLTAHGGHAKAKTIHAAVVAAGHRCHERKLVYHLNLLISQGHLVRAGTGDYWLPDALERSGEKTLARFPFGTTLKGRILFAMVGRGITRTDELLHHLLTKGVIRKRPALNNALSELRKEGYVTPVGYGVNAPSAKTYAHVGMVPKPAVEPRFTERVRPSIMNYLKEHGSTRSIVLIRAFGDPKINQSRFAIYAALDGLKHDGYIAQIARATWDVTDKPYLKPA